MAFQKNTGIGYSNKTIVQMLYNVLPVQFLIYLLGDILNSINGIAISGTQPTEALSAMAVCSAVVPFRAVFTTTVATGMVILCGHKVGSGNGKETRRVMTTASFNAIIAGIALTILVLILRVPIARFIGANDEILDYTVDYLTGIAFGITPMALITVLIDIVQMSGKLSNAIKFGLVQIVLTITAVFLTAYVFKGSLLQISLASTVATLITAIVIYIYIRVKSLGGTRLIKELHLPYIGKIILLGFPASLVSLMTGLRDVFITNRIVSLGGAEAAAAMGVLITIWFFIDGIVYGSGWAIAKITSVSYGERDSDSIQNIFKESMKHCSIITIIVGALYFVLAGIIAPLLSSDPAVIDIAVKLIRIFIVSRLAVMWVIVFISIFQSCKKPLAVFAFNGFAFLIFPVAGILLLENSMGIDAVWWSYTIGPVAMLVFWSIICIVRNQRFPKTMEDLLLLNDFSNRIRKNWLLTSKKQAVIVSEEMMNFLRENGASPRDSFICALCLEETVINIYDNAFECKDDEVWVFGAEEQCVDIQLCIDERHIIMRFRDNAKGFDLSSQASVYNAAPEDIIKNVGFRIISKYAKEMTYNRIYNMNILRIEI